MGVQIEDGYDVAERAASLGLRYPSAIAILPRNLSVATRPDELVYDTHALTIRKLWKEAGLHETPVERDDQAFPRTLERSADWIGPTVFIASLLLTQNPYAIQLAIGVIQDYATDMLRGRLFRPKVRLDVILETSRAKSTKRIRYEGNVEGLRALPEIIQRVGHDDELQ